MSFELFAIQLLLLYSAKAIDDQNTFLTERAQSIDMNVP